MLLEIKFHLFMQFQTVREDRKTQLSDKGRREGGKEGGKEGEREYFLSACNNAVWHIRLLTRILACLNLLVFVVPDANRLVHGTSGNEWLSDAHVHPRHLPMVEGVGEEVKCC